MSIYIERVTSEWVKARKGYNYRSWGLGCIRQKGKA